MIFYDYAHTFLIYEKYGSLTQFTEMRFASFLSGGFITVIVVNPPEKKLAKRTSVQCLKK